MKIFLERGTEARKHIHLKRVNGRRHVFMTKSPRKNVPDVGIELGAACMPSEHASDRATARGVKF